MTTHSIYREFKSKEEAIAYELQEIFAPLRPSKKGRRIVGKRTKYAAKLGFSRGNGELGFRGSLYLSANNPKARVRFARVFLDTVKCHLQSPRNKDRLKCPVYLVTFALERFCCSVAEARTYDLRPLQAWVRQRMEGLSYLGMVDVAFYSNISVDTGVYPIPEGDEAKKVRPSERDRRQTVSWHVHLFVWGVPRATLKTLVDEVNGTLAHGVPKNPSLVPGLRAADYREVKPEHFDGKVLYILKSPREYRVWDEKEELIDLETGEITEWLTGRRIQRSRVLRRGDGVRMFRVMQDRYLDHLMLGGGAGRDLLLSIRKGALQPLQSWERRQHRKPAR